MKHIIASLVWIILLVGVLVGYGNYVARLPHFSSKMTSTFSYPGNVVLPVYGGFNTNGSAMATAFH